MNRHFKVIRRVPIVCATLCLLSPQAQSGQVLIHQCPASIEVQQNISSHADGWKVSTAEPGNKTHALKGIYFSPDEYPADSCCDIPSEKKTLPRGDTVSYFDYIEPKKFDFWYVCGYEDTTVVLARKVPDNVVRCEVKYSDFPIQPRVTSFKCFDTPRK